MFMEISVGSAGSDYYRENEEIVSSCLRIKMTKELYSGLR